MTIWRSTAYVVAVQDNGKSILLVTTEATMATQHIRDLVQALTQAIAAAELLQVQNDAQK